MALLEDRFQPNMTVSDFFMLTGGECRKTLAKYRNKEGL